MVICLYTPKHVCSLRGGQDSSAQVQMGGAKTQCAMIEGARLEYK